MVTFVLDPRIIVQTENDTKDIDLVSSDPPRTKYLLEHEVDVLDVSTPSR